VLIDGVWSPTDFTNPQSNQPLPIYRWANRDAIEQQFLITNTNEVNFEGAGRGRHRDYNGLMLVLAAHTPTGGGTGLLRLLEDGGQRHQRHLLGRLERTV
jgi:hypothetical protein